jgi:hypothetical protein
VVTPCLSLSITVIAISTGYAEGFIATKRHKE